MILEYRDIRRYSMKWFFIRRCPRRRRRGYLNSLASVLTRVLLIEEINSFGTT